ESSIYNLQIYNLQSHDLDWYVRLQLSRMEGQLLPLRSTCGQDAALLRGAVSHRRDQLHVLPHAQREAGRRLGRADAVALQADLEGPSTNHARQPAEELRRAGQG